MLEAQFHRIRDRVMAISDRAFAEPIRLFPLTEKGDVDPERQHVDIDAILRVGAGKATAPGGISTAWRVRIHSQKAELHIDRSKYPDITVRARDKVRALARPGQPWFEVSAVDDRGDSRLVLHLNQV